MYTCAEWRNSNWWLSCVVLCGITLDSGRRRMQCFWMFVRSDSCPASACLVLGVWPEWLLWLWALQWVSHSPWVNLKSETLRLVAWRSRRTSVLFGRQTFPVLRLICSWQVTIYVGPSAISQPWTNSSFHSFGVDRWVVSCNYMSASATSVRGGVIWWTLTKERQTWRIFAGKSV